MQTTEALLNSLKECKNNLFTYLHNKEIDVSIKEGFNSLIPKVETIVSISKTKQDIPDISLSGCDYNQEDFDKYVALLNVTNASRKIADKFCNIPNIQRLSLKDLGIKIIESGTPAAFSGTPLEYLDYSDIDIRIFSVFCPTAYTSTSTWYPTSSGLLPTGLKTINVTNCNFDITYFGLYYLKNLENIIGLDTCTSKTPLSSIQHGFYNCEKLKEVDLSCFELDTTRIQNLGYTFFNCKNLEHVLPPKNIKDVTLNNVESVFSGCDKLPWEDIKNFLQWDTLDLSSVVKGQNTDIGSIAVVSAPEVPAEYSQNVDYTLLPIKRTIDKVSYGHLNLKLMPNYFFRGCRIKEMDLSNVHIPRTNDGFSYIFSDQTLYYRDAATNSQKTIGSFLGTFVDKLIIHNSSFDCSNKTNADSSRIKSFTNTQILDIQNTHFNVYYYNGTSPSYGYTRCSVTNLFIGWGFEEVDLSTVTFGDEDTTEIEFLTMFNGCNNIKRFICPNLKNVTYKITSAVFTNCKTIDYFDMSNVPLDNLLYSTTLPTLNKATFLSFGTNHGKGFTTKANNYNNYSLSILSANNVIQKECVIDMFNKLYDLNITYGVYDEEGNPGTGTLYTQQIKLHADVIAQLTPDEIAIVTNKGWTVS